MIRGRAITRLEDADVLVDLEGEGVASCNLESRTETGSRLERLSVEANDDDTRVDFAPLNIGSDAAYVSLRCRMSAGTRLISYSFQGA